LQNRPAVFLGNIVCPICRTDSLENRRSLLPFIIGGAARQRDIRLTLICAKRSQGYAFSVLFFDAGKAADADKLQPARISQPKSARFGKIDTLRQRSLMWPERAELGRAEFDSFLLEQTCLVYYPTSIPTVFSNIRWFTRIVRSIICRSVFRA
jgi:hypothetical protein